ncbi:MAG TPA: ABC transporter substrate binding protein [Gammaproteobacteria bacterium]
MRKLQTTGRLLTALLSLLLLNTTPAWGSDDQVAVIGDTARPYVNGFIRALKETLAKSSLSVVTLDIGQERALFPPLTDYRCVVTVGNEAARLTARQSITVPVLHALVTESLARELYGGLPPKQARSFLLVEQPVSRLLLLANRAMPQRKKVGIIYGPVSEQEQSEVQRAASSIGAVLVEREVRDELQLSKALEFFDENADLLITLPDPVIVNEGSIKTLMLGAYHGNLPLLGYSQAMVKAGALMAVHTTPEQFGRHSGELIAEGFWNDPRQSRAVLSPRYFEVSVNYQVARALAIDLPDEGELEARIRDAEQER